MALQKWEYRVSALHRPLNTSDPEHAAAAVLNTLGEEGWELVSVDDLNAYFRRPKDQESGRAGEPDPPAPSG